LLLVFISLLLGSTARKKIKLKLYLLFYILRAKKLAYLQIFKSSNLQIFKSSNLQIFKSSNYLNKKNNISIILVLPQHACDTVIFLHYIINLEKPKA